MNLTTKACFSTLAVACLVLTIGCRSMLEESGLQTPAPTKSDLFVSKFGGFVAHKLDTGGVELHYTLSLEPRKPIEQPMKLEVTFQNPEDRNKPLVATQEVTAGATSIEIESPPIWGLRPANAYEVLVRAYDSAGTLLGTHRQLIQSMIDTRRLERGKT